MLHLLKTLFLFATICFHQTFHVHLHEATQMQLNSKEPCSKWHTCTMCSGNTLMGKMSPMGCLLSQANCIGSCMQLWWLQTSHLEKFGASKAKILCDVHRLWLPAVWVETNSSQARWKWCSTGELEPIFNGLRAKTHRSKANEKNEKLLLDVHVHCHEWTMMEAWAEQLLQHMPSGSHTLFATNVWKIVGSYLRDIWEIFERYLWQLLKTSIGPRR